MKRCTHIFFDLDHTLWDYNYNARKVLADMYIHFGLKEKTNTSLDGFQKLFFKINALLWHRFNLELIHREDIRQDRFNLILNQCNGSDIRLASELGDYFLYHCPRQEKLIEGADLILAYLESKYELYVITNGFDDVQWIKLKSSGLTKYIRDMFTSETIGFRKPSKEIFEYALAETKGTPNLSIMIGDNPYTDIVGASSAGMTPVLFNPDFKTKSDCEIQVSDYFELMKLL